MSADDLLQGGDDAPALVAEDGSQVTYDRLRHVADEATRQFVPGSPVFVFATGGTDVVVALVAAFTARAPIGLFDDRAPVSRSADLIAEYRPAVVISHSQELSALLGKGDYVVAGSLPLTGTPILRLRRGFAAAHEELGLLLSTSGSTAGPKLVRLSRRSVVANARAIAEALDLTGDDRGPTFLPLCYSYGLSIVTSHLAVGGTVLLTSSGPASRRSIAFARTAGMTSLSGVPTTFRLARSAGVLAELPGTTRRLCTAGARMPSELLDACVTAGQGVGASVYSMYGQTEATARISILPPALLASYPTSVGFPVGDGRISIVPQEGQESGEVVFTGSSAMLGYAHRRQHLLSEDEQHGTVHTGDLGMLEANGLLCLRGRKHRVAKVSGLRLNLDEVEQLIDPDGHVAVVEDEQHDRLVVFFECSDGPEHTIDSVRRKLREIVRAGPGSLTVVPVGALPRTGNGKIAYAKLHC